MFVSLQTTFKESQSRPRDIRDKTLRLADETRGSKGLRLMKGMRIFRVYKLFRHFAGLQSLLYPLHQAYKELGLLLHIIGNMQNKGKAESLNFFCRCWYPNFCKSCLYLWVWNGRQSGCGVEEQDYLCSSQWYLDIHDLFLVGRDDHHNSGLW